MTRDPEYNHTFKEKAILRRACVLNKRGSYYDPIGFCEECNGFVYKRLPVFGQLKHVCPECQEKLFNGVIETVKSINGWD